MDIENSGFNIEELKEFIIKSLDYYDKNNKKYIKYINSEIEITTFDYKFNFIIDKTQKIKSDYEYIGCYDILNNVWIWGWLLHITNTKTELSRGLLEYGLKLDVQSINAEQIFLKNLLINSRYIVTDKIGLDINIAIFSYLLNEKILFIYPKKNNNIIIYYAIYNLDVF